MNEYYSRKRIVEERRNLHRAVLIIISFILIVFVLVSAGFPLLADFFNFLGNIKSGDSDTDKSDFIPPAPPQLLLPIEATNSALLNIRGTAEPSAAVIMFLNDQEFAESTAAADGTFVFENVILKLGMNILSATARDVSGNSSQASLPLRIQYSTALPKLEILTPADRQVFTGKDSRVTVSGNTNPGCRVSINDRIAIVESDGKFEMFFGLNSGENIFVIISADSAGNQERKEISVTYRP